MSEAKTIDEMTDDELLIEYEDQNQWSGDDYFEFTAFNRGDGGRKRDDYIARLYDELVRRGLRQPVAEEGMVHELRLAVLPKDGYHLYCRVNSSGGVDYLWFMVDLLAMEYGCLNSEAEHLVWVLQKLGELRRAIVCLEGDIRKLEELDRCNGTLIEQGEQGYLYANHAAGVECPLHGLHESGKRLRKYVGLDEEKVAEAREAVVCWERWLKKQAEQRDGRWRLQRLSNDLEGLSRDAQRMRVERSQ